LIDELQTFFRVTHAYPVCSGTFAVELALRMLQIEVGDEVVLAGYDFAGNFRAIEAVGARPVLVDIRAHDWSLDPQGIEQAASPRVKAMIVSHLHGCLAPIRELISLAKLHGWNVIEDACQVPGATIAGQPAGSWGDVGIVSFGGSKLLTAGRGGAVLTSHAAAWQRAKIFCEQGNHAFPLSELQAAVLAPQLEKLSVLNQQRASAVHSLVKEYNNLVGTEPPLQPIHCEMIDEQPAYYKLGWRVTPRPQETITALQERRDCIAAALQAEGIEIAAGFRGLGSRAEKRCRKVGDLHAAKWAAAGTLVLHHPILLESNEVLRRLARTMAEVALYFG
jgi:dTDP-4-amino-4,6-dideoxygalactose transaminase